MSMDELPRLLVIELIGSNSVSLVCGMRMPVRAQPLQKLPCVLCALV